MSVGPIETRAGGEGVEPVPEAPRRNMKSLAARVLVAQILALLALWALQAAFGG